MVDSMSEWIFNGVDKNCIDSVLIRNNTANIIPLDKYKFKKSDLPVFCVKNMAGIPFGFGINRSQPMLSFEHTHPPASFSIHGNRFLTQKNIKSLWFKSLYKQMIEKIKFWIKQKVPTRFIEFLGKKNVMMVFYPKDWTFT